MKDYHQTTSSMTISKQSYILWLCFSIYQQGVLSLRFNIDYRYNIAMHLDLIASESKVAYTLSGFIMHEFVEKNKTKVAQGNCLILQSRRQDTVAPLYYLKMNNFDFCKRVNESLFVRVQYPKSTSFLFFNEFRDNAVYSLSARSDTPDLELLILALTKNGSVVDYLSPNMKYETKVRLDYHIDNVLENEIVLTFNKISKIGKAFGGLFGKVSKKIIQKTAKVEEKFNEKVDRFSRESFSEQTRSKWGNVKESMSQVNEKITNIIKPINQSIAAVAINVGQMYKSSNNQYVKAFREFAKQTQNSINQGYQVDPPAQKKGSDIPPQAPINDTGAQMMKQHLVLNEQETSYPDL